MPHSPLTIPTSPSRQHLGYSRHDSKMDREPGSWASKLERRIDREARTLLPWEPDEYEESFGVCCRCESCAETENWHDWQHATRGANLDDTLDNAPEEARSDE